MSELEYCAFCDGGYAHSGICDKCTTEIGQTGKELADKDRQLAETRAEIEKLKVWLNENHAMDAMTIRNHARTIEKRDEEIKAKNKLIEQMRVALQSAVEDWAHKFNHDENPEYGGWVVQAGKILNELQNAALEAAERGG